MEILFCAKEVPWVINGPAPRGHNFIQEIYIQKLRKPSRHKRLSVMHFKFAWSIFGAMGFKFMQIILWASEIPVFINDWPLKGTKMGTF